VWICARGLCGHQFLSHWRSSRWRLLAGRQARIAMRRPVPRYANAVEGAITAVFRRTGTACQVRGRDQLCLWQSPIGNSSPHQAFPVLFCIWPQAFSTVRRDGGFSPTVLCASASADQTVALGRDKRISHSAQRSPYEVWAVTFLAMQDALSADKRIYKCAGAFTKRHNPKSRVQQKIRVPESINHDSLSLRRFENADRQTAINGSDRGLRPASRVD